MDPEIRVSSNLSFLIGDRVIHFEFELLLKVLTLPFTGFGAANFARGLGWS